MKKREKHESGMRYTCDRCGAETVENHLEGWTETTTFVNGFVGLSSRLTLNEVKVRHMCLKCTVWLDQLYEEDDDG